MLDERFRGLTVTRPDGSIIFGLRDSNIEARYRSAEHLNNALAQWERKAGRPLSHEDLMRGLPLDRNISAGEAARRFAIIRRAPEVEESTLDKQERYWRNKIEEQRISRLSEAERQLERITAQRLAQQTEVEKFDAINDASRKAISARFDRLNKLSDVLEYEHVVNLLKAGEPVKAEQAAKDQTARERVRIQDTSILIKQRIEQLQAEQAELEAELSSEAAPTPPVPKTISPNEYFDRFIRDGVEFRQQQSAPEPAPEAPNDNSGTDHA